MYFPDLSPLFYLAIIGLIAIAIVGVCGLVGLGWLVMHIQFVP